MLFYLKTAITGIIEACFVILKYKFLNFLLYIGISVDLPTHDINNFYNVINIYLSFLTVDKLISFDDNHIIEMLDIHFDILIILFIAFLFIAINKTINSIIYKLRYLYTIYKNNESIFVLNLIKDQFIFFFY